MPRRRPVRAERGQVLVIVALGLVILLGAAAFTIDLGRRAAEERYLQNAADAAALAGCRSLIAGGSDATAKQAADAVARANLPSSPSGSSFTLPAVGDALVYSDGHAGDPEYLEAGVLISPSSVRVAIRSDVDVTLGAIVGAPTLRASGRAQCKPQGGPAVPVVARRYTNAPGPGGGFVDFAATEATSSVGEVDTDQTVDSSTGLIGYVSTGRSPASETDPGPEFDLYGPGAKASNASDFRGFIALDVRNFEDTTSRIYYNGVSGGTNVLTLKSMQGAYTLTGYPGPMFPSVTTPADPNDQVAVMSGNDSAMVLGNFEKAYAVGDRVLLALYNGTVMEIPDFSITPPAAFVVPTTTSTPISGPSFTVSKNAAFQSTVTLRLKGDAAASAAGHPEYDLIPDPAISPPATGDMNEPTWSTDVFIPSSKGTRVDTSNLQTNSIPAGIYTVWLEGKSGDPYYQTRRVAVPVKVGGAVRDFSLSASTTSGAIAAMGGSLTLPIVATTAKSNQASTWGTTNPVSISWDPDSFTNCSLSARTIGAGQITFDAGSVVPTEGGATSNLTISSVGLAAGCYRFNVRATGLNGDNQPVTHIQPISFTVATSASSGSYVDIIGFAVFQITHIDANSITGRAVSGAYADPNATGLRRAKTPRLVAW
ncbi:MAG TPA: pilus assembly protein TadG-related protein [Candidatus Limnocylindria bacterium]|nr:pilus assembly protein TadG-related protein [Candidatus Limnocylindria bacterium]